jgi:hypothetical protein
MKQAAVQSSAAGSAAVNWSLNDSGSMILTVSECEPNAESSRRAVLEQRRDARGIIWLRSLLEGRADQLARLDHPFAPLRVERLFLGRHKFHHFRIWYRDQLSPWLREILSDDRMLR